MFIIFTVYKTLTVPSYVTVLLNFGISNTDISNRICNFQPNILLSILSLIFQIFGYLEDFNQSHLVQANEV